MNVEGVTILQAADADIDCICMMILVTSFEYCHVLMYASLCSTDDV